MYVTLIAVHENVIVSRENEDNSLWCCLCLSLVSHSDVFHECGLTVPGHLRLAFASLLT